MSIWDTLKKTSGFNMLQSFMDPGRAYEQAEKPINRSWLEAQGYLKPYEAAGRGETGHLQGAANTLLDPAALENQWAQGYEVSPYAQDEMARSKEYGLDAASSMGLIGSSPALESIQRNASSIMNADRSSYLQDLMQKYMAGVGVSQNLFGTGASMGGALGQGAMDRGQSLAGLRYGAAAAPGEMFGKLIGTAAGMYGAAHGVPAGGAGSGRMMYGS